MFLKLLFTDLPELFRTINFFPGILLPGVKFGRPTLSLVAGSILILAAIIISWLFYFKKLNEKKYQKILFGLIALAWLPLYINFTYNNFYDLTENRQALKYTGSNKRILRICNIDNRQNLDGIYCRLFSFLTFVKNNLPAGAEVELLTAPDTNIFFNYYLYPDHRIVDQADYLIFYYPHGYLLDNGTLYKREDGRNLIIGQYKMLSAKSEVEFILKKQ